MFWRGNPFARGVIGIMLRSNLIKNVIEVRCINARTMVVVITCENEVITMMSVYAPQCGCSTKEKILVL